MELTAVQSSLLRRVSFAKDAHVRVFKIQKDNTNGSSTPSSSPVQSPDPTPPTMNTVNDENAYPGSDDINRFRRRSSLRRSFGTDIGAGEQSMELDTDNTALSPFALLRDDDEFIDEENSNEFNGDDMDLTDIIRRSSIALARRRSSMGVRYQPPPEDLSREEALDISVEGSQAEHMEFTMPVGQSLREPSPPPDEWHALRAVTHAGDVPVSHSEERDENHGMDLSDAMYRLRAARASLGLDVDGGDNDDDEQEQFDVETIQDTHFKDASFASTDSDSFDDAADIASDKTVNMTGILQRQSLSGSSKESTSDFGSKTGQSSTNTENAQINKTVAAPTETLDKTPIYPDLGQLASANQNTLSARPPPVFQKSDSLYPNLTVFSRPSTAGLSTPSINTPITESETPSTKAPKPTTIPQPRRPFVFSSGTKPRSISSPSPGRIPNPTGSSSPLKRPVSAIHGNIERPTPTKKQAISRLSSTSSSGSTRPAGQLALSKKATLSPRKPSSPAKGRFFSAPGIRKTSATFTPRRSFGSTGLPSDGHVTGSIPEVAQRKGETGHPTTQNPLSPTQQTRNKTLSPIPRSPEHEREAVRQAASVSTPRSPKPESSRISSSRPASPQPAFHAIPQAHVLGEYLSEVTTERVGNEDTTERWREEVQGQALPEDDKVRISVIFCTHIAYHLHAATYFYRAVSSYDWSQIHG
jgi:hypothetical protein